MNRIQTYIDTTTTELLHKYAERNGCSISHAAGQILISYLACDEQNIVANNENKQRFLRVMNVLNQVLMCVYDESKVSIASNSAKDCLDKIKKSVQELNEN